ncbi:MAG: LUD domain-containing protein [Solirubrobacterales bacterium]|nr:LUD domain-containing protein [Solirubrobacterales bacterium]
MSDSRMEILSRIRSALADVPEVERPEDVAVPRDYRRELEGPHAGRLEERLRDYSATVGFVRPDEVAAAILEGCRTLGVSRAVIPPELPSAWRPEGVELVEDNGLSARELDELDGVITGCAVAIAETGTLMLDGQGVSGRRAITLIPDHHICVVRADQIVGLVPEAFARIAASAADRGLPITLISGPSATSDIELSRVEGVHGPRHLTVLIVED